MLGLQDDDSDLDFEIEAFPSVSNEASNEAAACVKVCSLVHGAVFHFLLDCVLNFDSPDILMLSWTMKIGL